MDDYIEFDDGRPPFRKSLLSNQKVYVRFQNNTNRSVEVIWLDYTGEIVTYKLLGKGCFVDVDTYKTHPWLSIDADSKDRLLVGKKFMYMPQTWQEAMQEKFPDKKNIPNIKRRVLVQITLPMHTLKNMIILKLKSILREPEDADQLEIPKQLINTLKTFIDLRQDLERARAANNL